MPVKQVTRDLNQRLAAALKSCGALVFWLGSEVEALPTLPIQLLTILLAEQSGVVPGQFKHIGKVTLVE